MFDASDFEDVFSDKDFLLKNTFLWHFVDCIFSISYKNLVNFQIEN